MWGPIIVVGVGNVYRSDDGIGLAVLEELRTHGLAGVMYVESNGDGPALLETWTPDSSVILIDAAVSKTPAGTILRFDALTQPLPTDFSFASTHNFGVAEAIRLAHTLHRLPSKLIIYAIVGKNFAAGDALSPEVAHALQQIVHRVRQEIQVLLSPTS